MFSAVSIGAILGLTPWLKVGNFKNHLQFSPILQKQSNHCPLSFQAEGQFFGSGVLGPN